MKTKIVTFGAMLFLALSSQWLNGQTNLEFTRVNATDEGNIKLTWSSVSNEVYQIQEADALINTNTGATTWNLLYDEYPSQGTNTFWLDTGNYNLSPQILNPKNMPMRFYRILDEGQDSLAGDEPIVSISSPSGGTAAVGELTVTVTAHTDQPILQGTKLYIDGQEMLPAVTITNYSVGSTNYEQDTYNINTCEWYDETHVLFATAESLSGYGDVVGSGPVMTGHGVSPFVPILFSNLVEEISFSQPSFNPSLGETQQVSAVFAANCDWTLQIENVENSNIVLTATGSGTSMTYDWDGTGTGETNLPSGIYYYFISAETNGESDDIESGGSGGDSGGTPPSPDDLIFGPYELYAIAPDSSNAVPLLLYPPGFDTNGFTIFSATPSEIASLFPVTRPGSGGGFTPDAGGAGGGGSGAASQNSPPAPNRPPINPISGIIGTFGVAYETYSGNGTNGYTFLPIPNEPGIPGSYIALDGNSGSASLSYAPLTVNKTAANNFIYEMQHYGWQCGLNLSDSKFPMSTMIGSGTPFNQVNLGLMMTHGAYGNTSDYEAGLCKQMYFPFTTSSTYLRLSQMNLGGSGTNGLEWFAIIACNSLYQANWNSMQSHGIKPYNSDLHLLLGTDTTAYTGDRLMQFWAQYMDFSAGAYFKPLTIQNAWYQAAEDSYFSGSYTNSSIIFAVAGDSACLNDYVFPGYNSSPGGTWTYTSQTVWTHP